MQSSLKNDIPKIAFAHDKDLRVEVVTFKELAVRLANTIDHNPFEVHKIEFYLILLVTKGSYAHFVDFKSYELTEGEALFIAQTQVHHFTDKLTEAEGIGIIFSSVFVDMHQFLTMNLKLNRLFNYHIETPLIRQEKHSADSLVEMGELLLREYGREGVFAKADMLLVSYKYLNDIIKKVSGKTVKAFIDDYVTMEIKRLLVSTSLSVKEISYKTGFEEPPNMVKFFKKNTGKTPLKFRQSI